jgi:hypothetical protein
MNPAHNVLYDEANADKLDDVYPTLIDLFAGGIARCRRRCG